MITIEATNTEAAAALLKSLGHKDVRIGISCVTSGFTASTYWPNGDPLKDRYCHGTGNTLAEAIEKMQAEVETAKAEPPRIKTAAACKAAVLDLINKHGAFGITPVRVAFLAAVEALPVEDR